EPYGYLPDGRSSEDPKTQVQVQPEEKEITFREALRKRSFLLLNVIETIRMTTTIAVVTHVMPYLGSLGISRTMAGLVAGAISVCSIIGRFGFGWAGDIFEKRLVMAGAFVFLGAGMLAFCYVSSPWILILFLLLFPAGFGGGMVLRGAILREYFGRQSFGKLIGITLGFAAIGEAVAPALAAWTYDTVGTYDPVWLALSGAVGIAIILILRLK
ncbi:MAG: MFS transporter, partial [Proteobacteria bacterium]|nr:MFS transporter [Pseudomonadota bacterium]